MRRAQVPVCTSLSPLPTAEAAALGPAEPARAALESAMRAYAADAYPSAVLSVYGRVGEDGRVRVVACLSACAANLPNFHAGAVRARWELVLPAAGAGPDAQLSGEVSARVHYFEDGNAQLDARESWSVALPLGGEGADALDVLALNAVARVKQVRARARRAGPSRATAARCQPRPPSTQRAMATRAGGGRVARLAARPVQVAQRQRYQGAPPASAHDQDQV